MSNENLLNKVIQGDCLEVMKGIEDNSIDLTVTSPPYYNAREYSHWDSYESYLKDMEDIFRAVYQKTKEGRMCVVNISTVIEARANRNSESKRIPIPFHFVGLMERIGFKFLEDIIWEKPEGASKNRNGGFYRHRQPVAYKPNITTEYILVFQKPMNGLIDKIVRSYKGDVKESSLVVGDYERTNVWRFNPETKIKNHSAPYPIGLPLRVIKYYSYCDDTVLDCFLGSGTTAVACVNTNRNFIGIELDEEYVAIANKRIEGTLSKKERIVND